jgi:hypothetical protein
MPALCPLHFLVLVMDLPFVIPKSASKQVDWLQSQKRCRKGCVRYQIWYWGRLRCTDTGEANNFDVVTSVVHLASSSLVEEERPLFLNLDSALSP